MPDSQYWLDLFQTIAILAMAVCIWLVDRRQAALMDAIAPLVDRIDRMPQHDVIARIFARIDDLHGDIRELAGRMEGVSRTLESVSEHLLRQKR